MELPESHIAAPSAGGSKKKARVPISLTIEAINDADSSLSAEILDDRIVIEGENIQWTRVAERQVRESVEVRKITRVLRSLAKHERLRLKSQDGAVSSEKLSFEGRAAWMEQRAFP